MLGPTALGVLTSGGDAPGMNAAVRAVVRTALAHGVEIYAIYEGYEGLIQGGSCIRKLGWNDVGGILQRGGTIIGTARSKAFRTREGRLQAAYHLLERGIDSLVVIGGDGSLTGADLFRREWPDLVGDLVKRGQIAHDVAEQHRVLTIAGLVGSIDNDMYGTDMTIGADTALHRITAAVDAIASTAASHQRSFVVEVMGRNCGYLALMAAIATGAEWVLIPESPPSGDWEEMMCKVLKAGRAAGRRDTIVIVAEGACDRHGEPISSAYVKQVLEERLGEDTRVTLLGHVQRGGSPSVFDRNLSTILGYTVVEALLSPTPDTEPQLFGIQSNRITRAPLMHCVEQTHAVAEAITAHDYERAMQLRGPSFRAAFRTHRTLMRAMPHAPVPGQQCFRFAILHADGPAPGMNTAVRAAVRLGVDQGHTMLGVRNGFEGLIAGDIEELHWGSVNGWVSRGGCELGTSRTIPSEADLPAIAHALESHGIQGLLLIGGVAGYQAMAQLDRHREDFPAFDIPFICLPASIDNNLPGCELSIGADTALNNIADAVDKIKQVGVAYRRCYVVEVMGRYCGYLAFMSGLATGAEIVYMHEDPITLRTLQAGLVQLAAGFEQNKQLGLIIRNELANPTYTTAFIADLFGEEGRGRFDVRHATLGHLQQGGDPTPFDRIEGTRLATACIEFLVGQARQHSAEGSCIGLQEGEIRFSQLADVLSRMDAELQRPTTQWWRQLLPIAALMAQPGSGGAR